MGAHVPVPTTYPGVATCRLEEVLMLSYTLLAVGSISVSAARWKEGRDNLVQAEQIVVQFKDAQLWENVVSQRAHLEFYHGNFAQSKELYEQAHRHPLHLRHPLRRLRHRLHRRRRHHHRRRRHLHRLRAGACVGGGAGRPEDSEPLHDGHRGDPDRAEPGRCCCCCCGGGD